MSADRDYLFLSKGHDVPALYGTLAEFGFFDEKRLANHLSPLDSIYWHPNRAVPGVEFHSGSLGHLPAVAIGVAMDIQMSGGSNRVFVIVGDGELNEGSVWEAALVAAARKLDNIVLIVDRNEFQANVRTEDLVPLEPIEAKFAAFGWATARINGHDFDDMERSFARLPVEPGKPTVVVADTVRGKGLASMERRADRWFVALTNEEAAALIDELHGDAPVVVTSEARFVLSTLSTLSNLSTWSSRSSRSTRWTTTSASSRSLRPTLTWW
jgi:transketolase